MQIFLADNLKNRFVPDGIALGGDGPEPPVKRDEDSVPVEWRIFAVGDNPAVKSGVPANIRLDADAVAAIVEYFDARGEEIPIDSHHYLHRLAEARQSNSTVPCWNTGALTDKRTTKPSINGCEISNAQLKRSGIRTSGGIRSPGADI